MDLRRYYPSAIRHPNRPDPAPVIRCKPDVVANDDGTYSLHNLSRSSLERLYELTLRDVRLYGLTYDIERLLGIHHEEVA